IVVRDDLALGVDADPQPRPVPELLLKAETALPDAVAILHRLEAAGPLSPASHVPRGRPALPGAAHRVRIGRMALHVHEPVGVTLPHPPQGQVVQNIDVSHGPIAPALL